MIDTIENWQTLIAGTFAIFGGAFAYVAALTQVREAEKERYRVLKSRLNNARTFFLVSIDSLKNEVEHLIERAETVLEKKERNGQTLSFARSVGVLSVPEGARAILSLDVSVPESVASELAEINARVGDVNLEIDRFRQTLMGAPRLAATAGAETPQHDPYLEAFEALRGLVASSSVLCESLDDVDKNLKNFEIERPTNALQIPILRKFSLSEKK